MAVRAAVYDLGSSSFHLQVCDVEGDALVPVARYRSTLDLGAAVGATGTVPVDRVAASLRVTSRMAGRLRHLEPDVVVAVGTAALRDAVNGGAVTARIAEIIGVGVHLLDGAEEARLCFRGQRAAVWSDPEPSAGIDLGGGSLELAAGDDHSLLVATSVAVGATRLRGELGDIDPVGPPGRRVVARRVAEAVADWRAKFDALGVCTRRVVASGGTARVLARLATARVRQGATAAPGPVDRVELPAGELDELAGTLCRLTLAQRLALPGMPTRRARSIAFGAAAMHAVTEVLGAERLVVSEWGLREGAILDAVADLRSGSRTGSSGSAARAGS
ncbi:MAG: hypothetical protein M0Z82_11190 [Actinomycetota bacterium]|jgi:exopolyphosphatase/guanosine-5'-triphosphate,3'-diphosphate pyrophosphatase|nr:hypothetical protein [Actinomycetota bacterium]